jgi:hypothetical protein
MRFKQLSPAATTGHRASGPRTVPQSDAAANECASSSCRQPRRSASSARRSTLGRGCTARSSLNRRWAGRAWYLATVPLHWPFALVLPGHPLRGRRNDPSSATMAIAGMRITRNATTLTAIPRTRKAIAPSTIVGTPHGPISCTTLRQRKSFSCAWPSTPLVTDRSVSPKWSQPASEA